MTRGFLLPAVLSFLMSAEACGAGQPAADIVPFPNTQSESAQATDRYTLETPIEVIAADPKGAAVLNKDIPGLLGNSRYDIFKSMNLRTIASLSGGKLSDQVLAQTKADLAALPEQASARKR